MHVDGFTHQVGSRSGGLLILTQKLVYTIDILINLEHEKTAAGHKEVKNLKSYTDCTYAIGEKGSCFPRVQTPLLRIYIGI